MELSERIRQDKRVINLAAEISDAADNVVPRLLLQLQGIGGSDQNLAEGARVTTTHSHTQPHMAIIFSCY